MTATRAIFAEITRALAVLALVFLSFAGSPVMAAHSDYVAAAGYDFCGTPPSHPVDHTPCHVCRADPVVLPTAPADEGRAFAVAAACSELSISGLNVSRPARTPVHPRAPPALV